METRRISVSQFSRPPRPKGHNGRPTMRKLIVASVAAATLLTWSASANAYTYFRCQTSCDLSRARESHQRLGAVWSSMPLCCPRLSMSSTMRTAFGLLTTCAVAD
jgi:hypothetical protein